MSPPSARAPMDLPLRPVVEPDQVTPLSVERNTAVGVPAKSRDGVNGSIAVVSARLATPNAVGRPVAATAVQFAPPSMLLQRPQPPTAVRNIVFVFVGSMLMFPRQKGLPTPVFEGAHNVPPLVVL